MAKEGERRMLFDIRGRRKHVVRVVYAILALLMGASLFLVVGPFNIGNLLGNSTSSTSAGKVLQEQADKTEEKLRREPESETLQVALARQRISAGNSLTEVNSEGTTVITPEGRQELQRGLEAWSTYKRHAKEPKAAVALLASSGYFSLAQTSIAFEEAVENVDHAAAAQRIAAELQPTINSLTTLAFYEYYAGNFAAGDKAANEAEAKASSKEEVKEISKLMAEFRKNGKAFEEQKKTVAKEEKKRGKERLENPFSGISGSPSGVGG